MLMFVIVSAVAHGCLTTQKGYHVKMDVLINVKTQLLIGSRRNTTLIACQLIKTSKSVSVGIELII